MSKLIAADVAALLRARNPLLWIVTREEARVERYIAEAAAAAGYATHIWDVGQGVTDLTGKVEPIGEQDPVATLNAIATRAKESKERAVWIMRDLPIWLNGSGNASTLRTLRNLARTLPTTERARAQAIIVLTPSADVPPELSNHATVIEWPLPDREEIASILDAALNALPDEIKANAAPNGTRDAAIDAAVGLSGEEAAACYARSLVQMRKIDPAVVSQEKKRVVARERVLEWFDPLPGGLDAVGGLDNLKAWLAARRSAYSPKAREYGLPAPKGAVLVGVPGCGKSLTAKAIATANDVEGLPPELLRKGRFDEVWWVDLPTMTERSAVLKAALKSFKRGGASIDLEAVASATDQFTGSEIAAIVPDALFLAFNDGAREITTADLIAAAKTVVPLSKTASEKIARLRSWAQGRARPATAPDAVATNAAATGRSLDF